MRGGDDMQVTFSVATFSVKPRAANYGPLPLSLSRARSLHRQPLPFFPLCFFFTFCFPGEGELTSARVYVCDPPLAPRSSILSKSPSLRELEDTTQLHTLLLNDKISIILFGV